MEVNTENGKLKLDKKTYLELKKMLTSTEEDFEMAVENIKNIDISSITVTLLAKHLVYGKRAAFFEHFKERIDLATAGAQIDTKKRPSYTEAELSWDNLFERFKESPYLTDFDKEMIQFELEKLIKDTLRSLDYTFIKKLKLDLKW